MKKSIRALLILFMVLSVALVTACGGGSSSQGSGSGGSGGSSGGSSSGGSSGGNNDQVFVLKASTAQDVNITQNGAFQPFVQMVEERSNGRIKIEYVGGPEAIPTFNQGEAVSTGVIDLTFAASGYWSEMVPEILVMGPSDLTYEEEIERGSIEFMSKFTEEKMNAKLLGRSGYGQFAFFMKEPVYKLEDFKGKNIRGHAIYAPLMESVGASVISMPGEEIYGALEKGMIDGFGWANYGITELGVFDLIKAKIHPPFNQMDIMTLVNLDTWNKLPKDLQEIMQQAAIDSFYEQMKLVDEKIKYEEEEITKRGGQVITLENPDEYLRKARELAWEWLGQRVENVDQFKPYFIKDYKQ